MACLAAGRHDLAEALIPATLPLPRKQRQQDGNVGSEIRDRAMLIETLITVQPDHPQLPALVRQLAESAPLNRWNSTQDVAFAVMALGHWIKIAPPEKPYQSAQLVLGDATAVNSASETLFWAASARPPEANRHPTTMPSEAVLANVKLAITGPADAVGHVSWLFTGVPLQPPANADHGMKIRREYRNADGAAVGDHALHSGELVQVVLTIESTTPLENVVIDDLLPAGLEIENPDLASSADADVSVHVEPTRRHRLTTFYRHHLRPFGDDTVADGNVAAVPTFNTHRRQVRDDRMVLMGELSMTGSAEISYLARAVTPGTFVVPPVQAECMYDNGINSIYRGGTTLVVLPVAADAVAKK